MSDSTISKRYRQLSPLRSSSFLRAKKKEKKCFRYHGTTSTQFQLMVFTTNGYWVSLDNDKVKIQLYCEQSLNFLCKVTTQYLSTRAGKPLTARNEGASPRRKNKRLRLFSSRLDPYVITSWFAIALDEIKNQTDFKRKDGLQAV